MVSERIKSEIQKTIKDFAEGNLTENALKLFQTLGYDTDRQAPLNKPAFVEFNDNFITPEKNFNESKALCSEWKYVNLLFQLSKEEIFKQNSSFDTKRVDRLTIQLLKPTCFLQLNWQRAVTLVQRFQKLPAK